MFSPRSAALGALLVATVVANSAAQVCPINSVCFAMDRSGSMRGFYDDEQRFVVAISRAIAQRTRSPMYSAWAFAGSTFLISRSTTDLEGAFVPAVNRGMSPAGSTNMYGGLNRCYNELKNQGAGNPEYNRVIVLITDGVDTGSPRASMIAPKIKAAGISIVTVGLGNGIDRPYLRGLASDGDLFVSSSFENLSTNVVKVAESSCKASMMTPKPKPQTQPKPQPAPPTGAGVSAGFGACQRAYNACGFRFKGRRSVPTVSVGVRPDVALTPVIESRMAGEKIGILNTNHVIPEFINRDGSSFNITMIGKPRFTPTHFKPLSVAVPMPKLNMTYYGSAVGHQTFHGTQRALARKRCVRLFFTTYQVLSNGMRPYVTGNINVKKSDNKCVVFLTN